jgi:hypothetical protein
MGMSGNLNTMPLPDVLQWLSQGSKTGMLEVRAARGVTKKVYFRKGAVVSSASSEPREFLGQFLIARGLLTEDQLRRARETQQKTGIMLGGVLTRVGILDEETLKSMLRLKAEEVVYDLFFWEEGEFHFEDMPTLSDDGVTISLDVMSLLMEGIRRMDEWVRIRGVIPSARAILARTDSEPDADVARDADLMRFYEAVDGNRSLEEIALELRAVEFQASTAAFRLEQAALILVTGEKPERDTIPSGLVPSLLVAEAERLLEGGQKAEAASFARWAIKADPNDGRARTVLDKAEAGFSEQFYKDVLPVTAVLELAVPMAHLSGYPLSPHEGFLATRFNGAWDLAAILKVSPIPQNEALRTVKKLLDLNILQVKKR